MGEVRSGKVGEAGLAESSAFYVGKTNESF